MFDPVCHLCDHLNAPGVRVCAACGAGLVLECSRCGAVRSGPSLVCLSCGQIEGDGALLAPPASSDPARRRVPPAAFEPSAWGGLPVLSLADAVPATALRPAASAPTAIDVDLDDLHLHDIDHPEAWLQPDGQRLPPAPVPVRRSPFVRTDSFITPPAPRPVDPPDVSPAGPPSAARVDLRDAKAARRAAVRRARLAQQAGAGGPVEPLPTEVLVVDRDDATRQRLCLLLDGFGFNVQSSRSTAQAVALLASRVYVAVFADVDLQDTRPEGGVEVCRLAKEGGPLPDGRRPALIVMSSRPDAAERVRAALAGSEQFLVKPLGRGDVARALEACDIPLPSDPRRA